MPMMPRPHEKPRKIAYKIMGIPANMRKQPNTKVKKDINKVLMFEETSRVR